MADQTSTIPKVWKMTTLGEVVFPVSDTFNFAGKDKVHFLNTGDILEGKLLHQDLVSIKSLPGQAKKSFIQNDILYSEIRPANKRYMLVDFDSSNSVASTKLMVLRTKGGVDVNFIYKFITFQKVLKEFQLIAESRSGTFPQITFDSISNFPLFLPPLLEQRAIAAVLSSLEDKIELLREQNKTLEIIAQAIFKKWFVNFNFPGVTGKTIDSELGQIPEGWKAGKLGDEVKTILGGTPNTEKKEYWQNGTIPWINSGKVNDFRIYESTTYITEKALKESATRLMPKGTVVIAITGATLGQVSRLEIDSTGNQSVIGILPNEKFSSVYLYYWMLENVSNIINTATGGAQQHINKNDVNNFDFIIPEKGILKKYFEGANPMIEKISSNCFQIQTLSSLRDILLPKLMKGEVRVKGFND